MRNPLDDLPTKSKVNIDVIHKFCLNAASVRLDLSYGAKVLCVQLQDGLPMLWVQQDPDAMKETRLFKLYPTGVEFAADHKVYLGTVQHSGIVMHVYEDRFAYTKR